MDAVKEILNFVGDLEVEDGNFELKADRFIVSGDEVAFSFSGIDDSGHFTMEGRALKTEHEFYMSSKTYVSYADKSLEDVATVKLSNIELQGVDEQAVCFVSGVWMQNGQWEFEGKLVNPEYVDEGEQDDEASSTDEVMVSESRRALGVRLPESKYRSICTATPPQLDNVYTLEGKLDKQIAAFYDSVDYLAEFYQEIEPVWKDIGQWLSNVFSDVRSLEDLISNYDVHEDIVLFTKEVKGLSLSLESVLNDSQILSNVFADNNRLEGNSEIDTLLECLDKKLENDIERVRQVGFDLYNVMIGAM